jgi:hypothetical protein
LGEHGQRQRQPHGFVHKGAKRVAPIFTT